MVLKLANCTIWSIALYGAETGKVHHLEHSFVWWETETLRTVDQKYLESFEMWCWRMMEQITWTDRVGNEEVLQK